MKLKRSLGQVFLSNHEYITQIADLLPIENEIVMEIGPGRGVISELIARKAKKFICIEKDPRFYLILKNKLSHIPGAKVFSADILKFSIPGFCQKIIVFGNIPYFISKDIIKYLVCYRNQIKSVYLTLQKEFAEKLLANASERQYGFLTCYAQYYAKIKKLIDIPASAFFPIPKVNSTFLQIDFYATLPQKAENDAFLFKIIRQAFSEPRKKVNNTLKPFLSKNSIQMIPKAILDSRPGTLSLSEYVQIAKTIYKEKNNLCSLTF